MFTKVKLNVIRPYRILLGLVLVSVIHINSYSQGRFLIVGGGNEKETTNSWSTPAYKWAAEGKRVAIISTSGSGYPDYFKNWCNAKDAKDFIVANSTTANQPALYDSLTTYQVIFFAGGDQWDYYSQYKNTKLEEAVNAVYISGGTIGGTSAGMHILSETLFTAENGTVYPDECIIDPKNKYVKLANDLFNFFPDLIFDTHMAERGRMPRLISFVANKALTDNTKIIGLGLDDMTCMTIDEFSVGTVYGTGVATIVKSEPSNFTQNDGRLISDNVRITQLLEGSTVNMKTMEILTQNMSLTITPKTKGENSLLTIVAGGEGSNGNNNTLLDFWAKLAAPSQTTLIITKEVNAYVTDLKNKVEQLTGKSAIVVIASTTNGSSTTVLSQILSCGRVIFTENEDNIASTFLQSENGQTLLNQIKSQNLPVAFLGSDARFIGKSVVTNLETEYASYDGKMNFLPGIGLLSNTVIIPETFSNSDFYENTITALPYAMILDSLQYGIWLTGDNYVCYSTNGSKATLLGGGKAPVLLLTNNGDIIADFSSKTANGSTSIKPRQVAGFSEMTFTSFDDSKEITVGNSVAIENIEKDHNPISITVIDNEVTFSEISLPFSYRLISIDGKLIDSGISYMPHISIPRNALTSPQVILLNVSYGKNTQTFKLIFPTK
ncbi:MAG: cyanophycinase [Sphingobacteriia bacterium]|nr:cyanophycinase [Sphingobacteriia bacterium]